MQLSSHPYQLVFPCGAQASADQRHHLIFFITNNGSALSKDGLHILVQAQAALS